VAKKCTDESLRNTSNRMSNSCWIIKQNEKFFIKVNLRSTVQILLVFIGSSWVTMITHNRADIQENHHRKSSNFDENSTNPAIYFFSIIIIYSFMRFSYSNNFTRILFSCLSWSCILIMHIYLVFVYYKYTISTNFRFKIFIKTRSFMYLN